MKITARFILHCMRHSAIWALDAAVMYAAYLLQHLLPPSLFELIMVVGGNIFFIYFLSLVWFVLCLLDDSFSLAVMIFFEEKEKGNDRN